MAQIILFDLDGTLTDPKEGITRSVAYALSELGIEVEDLDQLTPFIGPPLMEGFSELYGLDEESCLKAIKAYRKRYGEKGWSENKVYPGMEDMLETLCASGKRLGVATSKPEAYAVKILESFGLDKYFEHITGPSLTDNKSTKAMVVKEAMECFGVPENDHGNVLMVGDRRHDIAGAHANNVKGVGVLYGYGSLEELQKAGADIIARDVADLKAKLILS